ncbi:hypothetical protein FRC12_006861 [Ceratobasidium sp. 428]|nr:hypothetical protein FRC12_006861 [Ceratobasidium sp. 428]
MVISSAVMGRRLPWTDDYEQPQPGFTMSFHEAVKVVSSTVVERVLTPRWADNLTHGTKTMSTAFKELEGYLRQTMKTHHSLPKAQSDLQEDISSPLVPESIFSSLVDASDRDAAEKGKGLADNDVIGNVFLLLFAGHETTASALAFALGLLALYPNVQQEVYEQINQVMGLQSRLDYSDIDKLSLVSGAFLESLRMHPVTSLNVRIAEKDTTLTVTQNGSKCESVAVPANSYMLISHAAIHYNPTYWPEPEEFRPARFTGAYNRDAFVPFSSGGKVCIGQKFAETEATAALSAILARYTVSIDTALFPDIPGENFQARQERLLRSKHFLSVTPQKVPLVFNRRT